MPSNIGGVLGADCVITHSNESTRLWETETGDNLSYRLLGVLMVFEAIDGAEGHCSSDFETDKSSNGLNAAAMEGLNENRGRQDILEYAMQHGSIEGDLDWVQSRQEGKLPLIHAEQP